MAMKKRNVDDELKSLQAEATRHFETSRTLVQEEWHWINSPEGKDEIWESVRRDVLPQGTLAQCLFKAFYREKSQHSRRGAVQGQVLGNVFSSTLLGKILPASWAKYTPLAAELFEVARPLFVSTALALGRNLLKKTLSRLNPFRRKKRC